MVYNPFLNAAIIKKKQINMIITKENVFDKQNDALSSDFMS